MSVRGDSGSTLVPAVTGHVHEQSEMEMANHATILDIDPDARVPTDGMTSSNPTVEDLLRLGPAQIMGHDQYQSSRIRWVHLRSNCMSWIEELMDRVREERCLNMVDDRSAKPSTPTKVNPFLRKDLWANMFHGKASDQVQSRFMGPTCTPFAIHPGDEQSDSSGQSTPDPGDNIVLYVPYLNWESANAWDERQQLRDDVTQKRSTKAQADCELLEKYLCHKTAPLHDRRTLHQAYYHNFATTRSLPERTQVMQHFTAEMTSKSEPKLIVVDQLWLWIIRGTGVADDEGEQRLTPDLVITAFPGRFNGRNNSADIYHGIIEHLEHGLEVPLRKANDLAAVIVDHCSGVFFQPQLESDKWFLEFFATAIGIIREDQKSAFAAFCAASERLEHLQTDQASLVEVSRMLEHRAFSISIETGLFKRIKDIINEFACIDYILGRQEDVVRQLSRVRRSRSLKTVCEVVQERRRQWNGIGETAQLAYNEIQAQMDVKQKQSSLAEARTSRYQVEDSARHGRVMLLFTVVTIIFLPMSFLATWFGMNLKGTTDSGQLRLGAIAAVIFPFTIILAVMALAFAFSERLRDWLSGWVDRTIRGILSCLGMHGRSGRRRNRQTRPRSRRHHLTHIGRRDDMRLGRIVVESRSEEDEGGPKRDSVGCVDSVEDALV